jgi:FkbM family methyltransferase
LYEEAVYLPEVFYSHNNLRFADKKLKNYIANRDFLDCGAFIGDSALVLQEYKPRKIYSFEFAKDNVEKFKETMIKNKIDAQKVELIEKALGLKSSKLKVSRNGGADAAIETCGSKNTDFYEVEMISIDEFAKLNDLNAGFIKADLEGALFDVLKGAMSVIKKDRPVLSLSIYHTPEELFDVKPFLEEHLEEYVYELATGNFVPYDLSELILFAYPKEAAA